MTLSTALIDPEAGEVEKLAIWARTFVDAAKAPPGQPNFVSEQVAKITVVLERYSDAMRLTTIDGALVAGTGELNLMLGRLCAGRRTDPLGTCGGKSGSLCADCPRREGRSLTKKTLAG